MTKTTKPKKPTRSELASKVKELEAQLSHSLYYASVELPKAGNLMASGVLIQMTALGGREVVPPFVIKDGLSKETIEALHKDIVRSFNLSTQFKPKGAE